MGIRKQNTAMSSTGNGSENIQKISVREPAVMNFAGDSHNTVQANRKHWYTTLLSPLWLCLLVALIVRIWLTIHTHGVLDGDEALAGIQAERILQGNFPVYFYGLAYFGSLEAYILSIFIAILGPSVWALRLESTLISLILVYLTWRLASILAKAADLPPYARRCFTLVAGLAAAIPPLYDGVVELRTWGGWVNTFVLMVLLITSVFQLTRRWRAGASYRELILRWMGIGFIIGLGMWIYPLISIAILTSILWIVVDRVAVIIQLQRKFTTTSKPMVVAALQSLKKLLLAVAALPSCIAGFFPGILWGATHQWQNVSFIFSLGGTWSRQRLHIVEQVTKAYATCVAPRIVSGGMTSESNLLATLHFPLFVFSVLCISSTIAFVVIATIWHHPVLLRIQRLAALPTLFGCCAAVLYCVNPNSVFSLRPCDLDLTGRYATPLMLMIPFFFASIFTAISMFIYEKNTGKEFQSEYTNTSTRSSTTKVQQRMPVVAFLFLFIVLLAYLGAQASTYGLTDQDHTFQSPYCTISPANYDPVITYMQQQHIHYAWASNLLGYQIVFKTNSAIIIADPTPLIHPDLTYNRIPSYTDAVTHADRPSFLFFVQHGDTHPHLLQFLDAEHVTYRAAFFPSEPGVDVAVVTPLSRTVSPLESKNLDIFVCSIF